MSTDEKKSDELMDAIARKPGRPKADPVAQPVEGPVDELEQLRNQNADLMKMVMEMRAKLMPETLKPEDRTPRLDKKRPFSKTRSMDTGITYEQDGKTYNGKFELIEG